MPSSSKTHSIYTFVEAINNLIQYWIKKWAEQEKSIFIAFDNFNVVAIKIISKNKNQILNMRAFGTN